MAEPARMGWLVPVLAAVHLGLGYWSIRHHSATFDEPMHVAAGVALWKTGDPRLDVNNPPLAKLLVALPAALRSPGLPLDSREWAGGFHYPFGERFLYYSGNDGVSILRTARLVNLNLSLLLAVLVWLWTRRRWGDGPALTALAFYCLSPTLLGHASLATNDFPAVFFSVIALFAFDIFMERGRPSLALAAGASAAAAFLCKYSALLLIPACALRLLVPAADRSKSRGRGALLFGLLPWAGACALFLSVYPGALEGLGTRLWQVAAGTHPAYLLGRVSEDGWRWYYLAAFAFKSSLAELAVLAGGIWLFARRRRSADPGLVLCLSVVVLYLAAASLSRKQLGIRYMLLAYPMLACMAAPVVRAAAGAFRPGRLAAPVLVLAQALAAAAAMPHFLSFFNFAAGGPDNGIRLLVDSNLDWGQELPELAELYRRSGEPELVLSYFGTASPEAYGLTVQHLGSHSSIQRRHRNSEAPEKEWLAVSATNLKGVYGIPGTFDWLEGREPLAVLGHSLFVYDITRDARAHRRLSEMYAAAGDPGLAGRERLRASRIEGEGR